MLVAHNNNMHAFHTHSVVLDAYPNTATMELGSTLDLVCRVVGVPSTTVLSYQWTCGALVMQEVMATLLAMMMTLRVHR